VRYEHSETDFSVVFDTARAVSHRYLYGGSIDEVLVEQTPTTLNWALADRLGTVDLIVDDQGAVIDRVTFDSFGNKVSESAPDKAFRFGFTGRELDPETGLYYYRARYYDPLVGRFISVDSIGFQAGDTNLYRYVFNSPTRGIDPTGHGFDLGQSWNNFWGGVQSAAEAVSDGTRYAIDSVYNGITSTAQSSAEYYAQLAVDGEREGGVFGFGKQVLGTAGGLLSVLATKENIGKTAVVLAGGAIFAPGAIISGGVNAGLDATIQYATTGKVESDSIVRSFLVGAITHGAFDKALPLVSRIPGIGNIVTKFPTATAVLTNAFVEGGAGGASQIITNVASGKDWSEDVWKTATTQAVFGGIFKSGAAIKGTGELFSKTRVGQYLINNAVKPLTNEAKLLSNGALNALNGAKTAILDFTENSTKNLTRVADDIWGNLATGARELDQLAGNGIRRIGQGIDDALSGNGNKLQHSYTGIGHEVGDIANPASQQVKDLFQPFLAIGREGKEHLNTLSNGAKHNPNGVSPRDFGFKPKEVNEAELLANPQTYSLRGVVEQEYINLPTQHAKGPVLSGVSYANGEVEIIKTAFNDKNLGDSFIHDLFINRLSSYRREGILKQLKDNLLGQGTPGTHAEVIAASQVLREIEQVNPGLKITEENAEQYLSKMMIYNVKLTKNPGKSVIRCENCQVLTRDILSISDITWH
jgi:RHS repeat-associated protein